jgi:glycosyltransferase involved in cell wall biosynthesis
MKEIILLINSLGGGGSERSCVNIANFLSESGWNVTILVFNQNNSKYDNHVNRGVNVVNLGVKNGKNAIFKLYKYLKISNVNLIMTFHHYLAVLLYFLRPVIGSELKIVSRNVTTLSVQNKLLHNRSLSKYLYTALTRSFYNKIDGVICQSHGMKEDLICNYNFCESQLIVINNPVPKEFYDSYCNRKINLIKKVIFVGHYKKHKGVDMALQVALKVLNTSNNIQFLFYGEGPLKSYMLNFIKLNHLEGRLTVKSFNNNIQDIYSQSDCLVLTSDFEGFPNVLIESIATGLPIVAHNCKSGPSEIIINKVNGYLTEYQNVNDMAKKVVNIVIGDKVKCDLVHESALKYKDKEIMPMYIKYLESLE